VENQIFHILRRGEVANLIPWRGLEGLGGAWRGMQGLGGAYEDLCDRMILVLIVKTFKTLKTFKSSNKS